jgi:phosphotransferase system  glucose/maltose/N-acetylglucosamine-specific IIC component
VYGRVPLFYFIVHFFVLHLAQAITYLARGHSFEQGMQGLPGLPFKFAAPGEGYPLFIVYCIWILTVIIMYPICRWYDNYKTIHKEKKWLSYL